eukprot:superscaffoldBa00004146_g18354
MHVCSLLSGVPTNHPGRWSGLGSSSINLPPRDRRVMRGVGAALGGDLSNQQPPHHYPPLHNRPLASDRHTAREERYCQGVLAQSSARNPAPNLAPVSSNLFSATSAVTAQASPTAPAQLQVSHPGPSTNQCPGSASAPANHTAIPSLSSRQPEGVSSSSESLTPGGGGGVSLSGLGVNKSHNVNREGRGGACAAAENGPQVHSSRNLQEMSDFGEVVDLVCL